MSEEAPGYLHVESPLVAVTLDRGMKGQYGWAVKATAPTVAAALALVADADGQLRAQFGGEA